jgi:signal transduction histidine kinase
LEDLRDPTLEHDGLLAALRKRADLIGRGRIEVQGQLSERLPTEVEGILYRIGQQAMDNAVKHSGVRDDPSVRIRARLVRADKMVALCVKDDGLGFDADSDLAQKWGLRRLRDTLTEMGGSFDIRTAPGEGTTICAAIDLTERGNDGG